MEKLEHHAFLGNTGPTGYFDDVIDFAGSCSLPGPIHRGSSMRQCVATTLRSIRTVQKLKEYPQFQFPLPELVSHVEITATGANVPESATNRCPSSGVSGRPEDPEMLEQLDLLRQLQAQLRRLHRCERKRPFQGCTLPSLSCKVQSRGGSQ